MHVIPLLLIKSFQVYISETFRLAGSSLKNHLTRSILSLTGIAIGIFSIILVFTIIDSLEQGIKKSIQTLGTDIIYVQKWPWIFEGEYPWWKYISRPYPTFEEANYIQKNATTIQTTAFVFSAKRVVTLGNVQTGPVSILGVSYDYPKVRNLKLKEGRYFTRRESDNGHRLVIIGCEIADVLFPSGNALGNYITVSGVKCKIIGVLEKEGKSIFGISSDRQVFMSYQLMSRFVNPKSELSDPFILCRKKENVSLQMAMDELEKLLRAKRKIRPSQESTFALNKITILQKGFENLFSLITLAGWLIGGFSILVGGFGVANIMYVSVSERTRHIGIQMSLGANRFFIMLWFLWEGIFLCILGGVLGLIISFSVVYLMKDFSGLELILSSYNILLALQLSFMMGIVSSFLPSYQASQLDPVEAMRK